MLFSSPVAVVVLTLFVRASPASTMQLPGEWGYMGAGAVGGVEMGDVGESAGGCGAGDWTLEPSGRGRQKGLTGEG